LEFKGACHTPGLSKNAQLQATVNYKPNPKKENPNPDMDAKWNPKVHLVNNIYVF
jgi:hypothetical protein